MPTVRGLCPAVPSHYEITDGGTGVTLQAGSKALCSQNVQASLLRQLQLTTTYYLLWLHFTMTTLYYGCAEKCLYFYNAYPY